MSGPRDGQPRGGAVVTPERRQQRAPYGGSGADNDPEDDVARARANVRNADLAYGPRRRASGRSTAGDRIRGFVRRYGWRAYALPVLFVVTVAALMTTTTASSKKNTDARPPAAGATSHRPPVADGRIALKDDAKGKNFSDEVLKAAALPRGAPYTTAGTGKFTVLPGTSPKVGTGKLFRYSIDVEKGVRGVDLAHYQKLVVDTMADPRSWSGHGVAVQRVDSGAIDFHVTLTAVMTVRKLCGYDIPVETSCYVPAGAVDGLGENRVVFNVARWVRGSTAYLGDLDAYRIYMINHENGHALGHNHAHQCLPGGLAPVMMQQTFGLRSTRTDKLCQANPWPYPPAVEGAPGAEQRDTQSNNEYGRGD